MVWYGMVFCAPSHAGSGHPDAVDQLPVAAVLPAGPGHPAVAVAHQHVPLLSPRDTRQPSLPGRGERQGTEWFRRTYRRRRRDLRGWNHATQQAVLGGGAGRHPWAALLSPTATTTTTTTTTTATTTTATATAVIIEGCVRQCGFRLRCHAVLPADSSDLPHIPDQPTDLLRGIRRGLQLPPW